MPAVRPVPNFDPEDTSLDPQDWREIRAQGHRMLDDMFDHMAGLRDQPVWRKPTPEARASFRAPLPMQAGDLAQAYEIFRRDVLPYGSGNTHPGFMGWVQGAGTPVGMLAEMLAAGMNANLGGRDHMPIEVERQILSWVRRIFGFPQDASGLFVSGASQANFLAVLVARARALGLGVRRNGVSAAGVQLTAYASKGVHGCLPRSLDMAGLGADSLRLIEVDAEHRMDLKALSAAIARDRSLGLTPFMIIGTAGTVDVGAIDDLNGLADIAAAEGVSFHVDGALGALAVLSPELAARVAGLERCDSLAFDFHKWGHVPYDAGYLLVRDAELHHATFANPAVYLARAERGIAAGDWWPCDYGSDLSRGFRALKTWFTLQTYGLAALGDSMAANCALARALAARVESEPELELLAPVALNIVCFRYRRGVSDALTAQIVSDLQEAGEVAPSLTIVNGQKAIRAAIINHRTRPEDIELLVDSVIESGRRALQSLAAEPAR
ncbi:pyridoxal phosphate-dependent decarboxylase family protein [Phenylobacterium sp.]|uniref:pyridoxal phosphate-dependent decarboxylase family protein n=1 Tax=Phenylobacterium sp. TaxID=1871053 RepID=UPI002F4048FA